MSKFLHETNFSLYTVPAAWPLCIGPHIWAVKTYERLPHQPRRSDQPSVEIGQKHKFDKVQPRTFMATLESNPALPPEQKYMLARAEAASWNGYENLGFFAASVVAANVALLARAIKVAPDPNGLLNEVFIINALSLGYIAQRMLFNIAYINGSSGEHRGAYFYGAIACSFGLFIRAGNTLRTVW